MRYYIRKSILILFAFLFLSGCNKGDKKNSMIAVADPVIGVKIESTGETVYTVEELQAAIARQEQARAIQKAEADSNEPENIPAVTSESDPISEQPDENQQRIIDRESMVASYANAVRAAIGNAIGDRYDANFGYDTGTITLYEAGNTDIVGLERYLEQVAAESGLQGYDIQITAPMIFADITASDEPYKESILPPEPTMEPIPTIEPVPTSDPTPITAQVANNQGKTINLPPGTLVWKTRTGEKFHKKQKCGNSNPDTTVQITIEDAVYQYNLEACDTCYQGQY